MKNTKEEIITRAEVAIMLQACERTITRWSNEGLLKPVRLPLHKHIKGYRREDIEKILSESK